MDMRLPADFAALTSRAGSAGQAGCALAIRGVHKSFEHFVALQDVEPRGAPGRAHLLPRALGLRQDDAAADHRGARGADRAGTIVQAGRDISRLPPMQRDYGIVFQSYALFPNLSVAENVAYGLVNRRMPERSARRG